jgi:hypothetical protein
LQFGRTNIDQNARVRQNHVLQFSDIDVSRIEVIDFFEGSTHDGNHHVENDDQLDESEQNKR